VNETTWTIMLRFRGFLLDYGLPYAREHPHEATIGVLFVILLVCYLAAELDKTRLRERLASQEAQARVQRRAAVRTIQGLERRLSEAKAMLAQYQADYDPKVTPMFEYKPRVPKVKEEPEGKDLVETSVPFDPASLLEG